MPSRHHVGLVPTLMIALNGGTHISGSSLHRRVSSAVATQGLHVGQPRRRRKKTSRDNQDYVLKKREEEWKAAAAAAFLLLTRGSFYFKLKNNSTLAISFTMLRGC